MASQKEVIDLTHSPQQEFTVLSDDEPDSRERGHKNPSKRANAFSLLNRLSDTNGSRMRYDSGGGGVGMEPKRKRKKKKKATVVVEDGDIGQEVDEGSKEDEVEEVEKTNGHHGKGKEREGERTSGPSQHGSSLLDRIAGIGHPAESSTNGRKASEVDRHSEGHARVTGRNPKRRKRKERDMDEDIDRPRSFSAGRRRSYSPERQEKDGLSPSVIDDSASSLFFIDVKPVDIPVAVKASVAAQSMPSGSGARPSDSETQKLLLPAHVSLLEVENGDVTVQILPTPPLDPDEEDYIDYFDYGDDDRKGPGVIRYFEDPSERLDEGHAKPRRFVCKNCGAADDHKSWDCPCLTCGARDEHSTRGCPISKVCFSCGMKGHTRNTCPNRYDRTLINHYDDCDRCGSSNHQAKECPTLWRMYEYVDDEKRQETLYSREEKAGLAIGDGGEGYIAPDEWCYNCGESGHLGDDCESIPHPYDFPREPSAFGMYNIASGPFFDPSIEEKPFFSRKAKRPLTMRDAEEWADGHGFVLPADVGKQGRKKEKERLAKKVRDMQVDEEEDWFNRPVQDNGRGVTSKNGARGKGLTHGGVKGPPSGSDSKKLSFGNIGRDRSQHSEGDANSDRRHPPPPHDDLPTPSRETDSIQIRGAAKRFSDERRYPDERSSSSRRHRDDRHSSGSRDKSRWRDRYDDYPDLRRDRDRYSRNVPRYKGGYGQS